MPRNYPSDEMMSFAAEFGGIVLRDAELPFGCYPPADPALDFAWNSLEDFDGAVNSYGDTFSFDLQVFDDMRPNAVCGFRQGRFCIGLHAGIQQRILEISAALVRHIYLNESSSISASAPVGFGYLALPDFEESHRRYLEERLIPLHQADLLDHYFYTSNLLNLFVLFHEMHHAVDGHVAYFVKRKAGSFLGEMKTGVTWEDRRGLQLLCELDADSDSFFTLAINLLQGRPFFEFHAGSPVHDLTEIDRLRLAWLGTLFLANTWALGEDPDASFTSHPPSIVRILNLFNLPFRLRLMYPEFSGDLDTMMKEVSVFFMKLVEQDDNFIRLAAPLIEKGSDRYMNVLSSIHQRADLKTGMEQVHKCGFIPKNMPIVGGYK